MFFVEHFEVDEAELFDGQTLFEGLGLDSLDAIDIVVNFQSNYGIKPSEQELFGLKTLDDIYLLAEKYQKNG